MSLQNLEQAVRLAPQSGASPGLIIEVVGEGTKIVSAIYVKGDVECFPNQQELPSKFVITLG